MVQVNIDVQVSRKIFKKAEALIDDVTMLRVHDLLAKMCDPYVPMDEGVLAQTTEIMPEYVRYTQPYAHYQYTGLVYGPNYPIVKDGVIVGWYSPPGQPKHPTGAMINYNTERHPLASAQWDQAMLRDKREEFCEQVKQLLIRRSIELYGS